MLNTLDINTIDSKTIKYEINEDSGFMQVSGVCARSGVQEYLGSEVGLTGDDADKVFNVYRPKDEVLASLSSYNGAIVTDNHPLAGLVTTDSYTELSKGSTSEAVEFERNGELFILAKATITNQDTIESIKSGKRELSAGYSRDLVKESGVHNGENYDFVQKNIRVNHVAIVDEGRCGNTCKLNLDNKGVTSMNIQIDGRAVQMDEASVVSYIGDLKKSLDTAVEKEDETKKELDAEIESKESIVKQLAELTTKLAGMMTPEEAEAMSEDAKEIEEDAKSLDMETKEKSNDGKMKEILNAISDNKHSFDSMDSATLKTVYKISVDQAIKAKKIQKDGYSGTSNDKKVLVKTGNYANDMNAILSNKRNEKGK